MSPMPGAGHVSNRSEISVEIIAPPVLPSPLGQGDDRTCYPYSYAKGKKKIKSLTIHTHG